MLSSARQWPVPGRGSRTRRPRLTLAFALTAAALRRCALPGDSFAGVQPRSALGSRVGQTRAGHVQQLPRRATPDIPADELAPDEVAQQTLTILPKLPPVADMLVGGFLYIFPVAIIVSWVTLNVTTYNKSKEAKDRDQKRKIRKALKTDDKLDLDEEMQEEIEAAPRRRRKRRTALQESFELEEAARRRG